VKKLEKVKKQDLNLCVDDMKRRLISAFSNTDNSSFDATYTPIARPGGQI